MVDNVQSQRFELLVVSEVHHGTCTRTADGENAVVHGMCVGVCPRAFVSLQDAGGLRSLPTTCNLVAGVLPLSCSAHLDGPHARHACCDQQCWD